MTREGRPFAEVIKGAYWLAIASLLPILSLNLPFNTTLFDYANGALIGCWLLYLALHRRPDLCLTAPFVVVLLASLLSMFNSRNLPLNVLTLVQEAYLALFFIVLFNALESTDDVRALVRWWMLFAALEAGVLVVEVLRQFTIRAQGTFDNPNMAASYVGVSAFLVLHPKSGLNWLLRMGYAALMAAALIATKSLSGVAGAALATALGYGLYWLRGARGSRLQIIATGVAVALVAGMLLTQVTGVHNFLDREPKSVDEREQIWREGARSFLRNPLGLSVGPGGFVASGFVSGGTWGEGRRISLHSDYLSFLVERGVLGFAGLLALLGVLGSMAWRSVRAGRTREELVWRLGLCAMFCFILVDAASHEVLHYRHVWVVFSLIAVEARWIPQGVRRLRSGQGALDSAGSGQESLYKAGT